MGLKGKSATYVPGVRLLCDKVRVQQPTLTMKATRQPTVIASLGVMLCLGGCTDAGMQPCMPLTLANTSWVSEQVSWVAAPPEIEHLYEVNHREGVLDVLHFAADGTVLKITAAFGDNDRSPHLWLMDGSGYVVDQGTWKRKEDQLVLRYNIRFDHYFTYRLDSTDVASDTFAFSPMDATTWRLRNEERSFVTPAKALEWSMIDQAIAP